MTAAEILEGNKLFAEFEGYEYINDDPAEYPHGYMYKSEDDEGFGNHNTLEEMEYHSSWDHLMPVWKKVIEVIGLDLSVGTISQHRVWLNASKNITSYISNEVDIEKAFSGIVNLIKWYNNNHPSK